MNIIFSKNTFSFLKYKTFQKGSVINLNTMLKIHIPQKYFCTSSSQKLKTIDLIKILRAETNSPLNHIKKSLEETNNNLEEARVLLKKKGFKEAENRMNRSANTKLYGMKVCNNQVAVTSLSCETDFVSGTDLFLNFSNILLDVVSENEKSTIIEDEINNTKILNKNKIFDNMTLLEGLKILISGTQENCKIGPMEKYEFPGKKYIIGSYLHSSPNNNSFLGQKASFVVLETSEDNISEEIRSELNNLAERLAMQIVACNPKYLNISDIPNEIIANESRIIKDGIISENPSLKTDNIEKIAKNKLNSWYEEVVLNEQVFIIIDHDSSDSKMKVSNFISKKRKDFGVNELKIKFFKLFK